MAASSAHNADSDWYHYAHNADSDWYHYYLPWDLSNDASSNADSDPTPARAAAPTPSPAEHVEELQQEVRTPGFMKYSRRGSSYKYVSDFKIQTWMPAAIDDAPKRVGIVRSMLSIDPHMSPETFKNEIKERFVDSNAYPENVATRLVALMLLAFHSEREEDDSKTKARDRERPNRRRPPTEQPTEPTEQPAEPLNIDISESRLWLAADPMKIELVQVESLCLSATQWLSLEPVKVPLRLTWTL